VRKGALGDVIDQQNGCAVAVEGLHDGPEGLLSGCVPDLQADSVIIVNLDELALELRPCVDIPIPG
jgi:hypothetical protein